MSCCAMQWCVYCNYCIIPSLELSYVMLPRFQSENLPKAGSGRADSIISCLWWSSSCMNSIRSNPSKSNKSFWIAESSRGELRMSNNAEHISATDRSPVSVSLKWISHCSRNQDIFLAVAEAFWLTAKPGTCFSTFPFTPWSNSFVTLSSSQTSSSSESDKRSAYVARLEVEGNENLILYPNGFKSCLLLLVDFFANLSTKSSGSRPRILHTMWHDLVAAEAGKAPKRLFSLLLAEWLTVSESLNTSNKNAAVLSLASKADSAPTANEIKLYKYIQVYVCVNGYSFVHEPMACTILDVGGGGGGGGGRSFPDNCMIL